MSLQRNKKHPVRTRDALWHGQSTQSVRKPGEKSLRAKRRARKVIVTGIVLFCAVSIGGFSAWLSHRSFFLPQAVAVSGTDAISPRLIEAHSEEFLSAQRAYMFSRANALLFPAERFEARLHDSFPRILSASAGMSALVYPSLQISIVEREPYARWCSAETCFLMDKAGFIFGPDEPALPLVRYEAGLVRPARAIGSTFLPSHFEQVRALVEALSTEGIVPKVVRVENERSISITTDRGFAILAPIRSEPALLAARIDTALSAAPLRGRTGELEYVDARFENRVYYRFLDGSGTAPQEEGGAVQ